MFGTILLSICTVMHIYVFWRALSVPFITRHLSRKIILGTGIILWIIFLLGRLVGHNGTGALAGILEFLGMSWLAILFLTFSPLLATDIFTLFGFLMPRLSATLRGWALLTGLTLSAIALAQGIRPPIIEKYEVSLAGLPVEMDGTVLVAMSDMHLGSQLGERWLASRIAQVKAERPDLVVLLGDIFEGHGPPEDQLITTFKQLTAPLGVWAVPGNHEFYGGDKMKLFKEANFNLLNNSWAEIKPGLILAGVDDLTNRYRNGQGGDPISQALANRPAGATILLSHTPWQAEKAAAAGVGLMLSGHTHGGQIWPFGYLVQTRYPLLAGRYKIDDMTAIVCRGTGTWGPRMRLWRPSEILSITLRTKTPKTTS
ncbi:MAG: metallophosphoesterase [Proteobacteria bacterium]|nr:metallophosphoesterase [Pseudomonadota bacterium]MBU1716064.1 metallophosphoesterase [Pseudomonadota bacterium]